MKSNQSQDQQPADDSQKNLLPNVGSLPYLRYWVEGGQFIFVTIPATITTIKPPKHITTVTDRVKAHLNQYSLRMRTYNKKCIMPLEIELLDSNNKFAFIRAKNKVKTNDLCFYKESHNETMEYYVASVNNLLTNPNTKKFDIESLKNDNRIRIEKNDALSIALTEAQNSFCPSKSNTAGDMKSESSSSKNCSDVIMTPEPHTALQNDNMSSRQNPLSNSPRISAAAGSILSQENLPPAFGDQKQGSGSHTQISKMIASTVYQKSNKTPADGDVEMPQAKIAMPSGTYLSTTLNTLRMVLPRYQVTHSGGGSDWTEPHQTTNRRNNWYQ